MARRSSKRASGSGDRTGKPQDKVTDVTDDAVDAAPADETAAEPETVEASATDGPGSETATSDAARSEDAETDAETGSSTEEAAPDDTPTPEGETAASADSDAADGRLEPDPSAPHGDSPETGIDTRPDADVDTPRDEPADDTVAQTASPEDTPAPAAPRDRIVEKRGPGFIPLVLGGLVAAAIGYFASFAGLLPGAGGSDRDAEIESALARQSEVLGALQEQVAALDTAQAPTVDLSPVTDEIAGLGARIDETAGVLETLGERVATLEERPVFTGDVAADAAEAAEAVAAMEEQMRVQEEEAARLAAEAEAAARDAEQAIAAAEAEAAAAMAEAEAEAALNELRLAVAEGSPFAEPLADIGAVVAVPDALSAAAETGVVSLENLQQAFPAAARAALPVALRETAGDGAMDRLTAFVQGQVGGRAVAPREGDDPDAVLSRAQAAVTDGDLETALAEISALPDGAKEEMAGWISDAEARTAVVSALETVAADVTGAN